MPIPISERFLWPAALLALALATAAGCAGGDDDDVNSGVTTDDDIDDDDRDHDLDHDGSGLPACGDYAPGDPDFEIVRFGTIASNLDQGALYPCRAFVYGNVAVLDCDGWGPSWPIRIKWLAADRPFPIADQQEILLAGVLDYYNTLVWLFDAEGRTLIFQVEAYSWLSTFEIGSEPRDFQTESTPVCEYMPEDLQPGQEDASNPVDWVEVFGLSVAGLFDGHTYFAPAPQGRVTTDDGTLDIHILSHYRGEYATEYDCGDKAAPSKDTTCPSFVLRMQATPSDVSE